MPPTTATRMRNGPTKSKMWTLPATQWNHSNSSTSSLRVLRKSHHFLKRNKMIRIRKILVQSYQISTTRQKKPNQKKMKRSNWMISNRNRMKTNPKKCKKRKSKKSSQRKLSK